MNLARGILDLNEIQPLPQDVEPDESAEQTEPKPVNRAIGCVVINFAEWKCEGSATVPPPPDKKAAPDAAAKPTAEKSPGGAEPQPEYEPFLWPQDETPGDDAGGQAEQGEEPKGPFNNQPLSDFSIGRFLNAPPPPLEYRLEKSFLKGDVGALVGPGGSGKSFFGLQLGMACATGDGRFIGDVFKPSGACGVVFITAEDSEPLLWERAWNVFTAYKDRPLTPFGASPDELKARLEQNLFIRAMKAQNIKLLEVAPQAGPVKADAFENLVDWLTPHEGLGLIVLDPTARLVGADETNAVMNFFVCLAEEIADKTGANVLLLHHIPKNFTGRGGKTNLKTAALDASFDPEAARGGSAFTAGVRWQANFFPLGKEEQPAHRSKVGDADPKTRYIVLNNCKNNGAPTGSPEYFRKGFGGVLFHSPEPAVEDVGDAPDVINAIAERILAEVARVDREGGIPLTKNRLKTFYLNQWKSELVGATETRLVAVANNLVEEGRLCFAKRKVGSSRRPADAYVIPPAEGTDSDSSSKPEWPHGTKS